MDNYFNVCVITNISTYMSTQKSIKTYILRPVAAIWRMNCERLLVGLVLREKQKKKKKNVEGDFLFFDNKEKPKYINNELFIIIIIILIHCQPLWRFSP